MSKRVPTIGIRRGGFTLIEIMLALLVVMIGVVAMTGLLGTSLDSSAKAHDDLGVVSFSDMVFNYYHAVTNWNEIPPGGPEALSIPDFNGSSVALQLDAPAAFTCRVPGFGNTVQDTYTVTYRLHAEAPSQQIKELTLEVWPGFTTNDRPRTFYTEIFNWANQ